MSNRLWTLPLVVAFLVAAAVGAHAIPSLGGPTGIVSLPNADIAPIDELQAAVSYQAFETMAGGMAMYEGSSAANDAAVWALQAVRGVSEEAELWAAYSRVHNWRALRARTPRSRSAAALDDGPTPSVCRGRSQSACTAMAVLPPWPTWTC